MNCASLADGSPIRLTDTKAAKAFVSSAEVVVVGFLEVGGRRLCTERNTMNRGQKYASQASYKHAHKSHFMAQFIARTRTWQTLDDETN